MIKVYLASPFNVELRKDMNNAIDIVKEKADEIKLSNDEDGVAIYLEKLLKNNTININL